jgi:hypothetical protein
MGPRQGVSRSRFFIAAQPRWDCGRESKVKLSSIVWYPTKVSESRESVPNATL